MMIKRGKWKELRGDVVLVALHPPKSHMTFTWD
jgi:hypothetical protein